MEELSPSTGIFMSLTENEDFLVLEYSEDGLALHQLCKSVMQTGGVEQAAEFLAWRAVGRQLSSNIFFAGQKRLNVFQ